MGDGVREEVFEQSSKRALVGVDDDVLARVDDEFGSLPVEEGPDAPYRLGERDVVGVVTVAIPIAIATAGAVVVFVAPDRQDTAHDAVGVPRGGDGVVEERAGLRGRLDVTHVEVRPAVVPDVDVRLDSGICLDSGGDPDTEDTLAYVPSFVHTAKSETVTIKLV